MIAAGEIALLRPLWLAALPLIALAWVWPSRARASEGGWARVMDPELLAYARAALPQATGRARLPIFAAAALIALALSGPALRKPDAPSLRNLDAVMLAIDLSPSIAEGPRLEAARIAAAELLCGTGGRPLGLILFAGEPYLVAPPSDDPATLETPIAVMGADTMPEAGSHPERALAAAAQRLRPSGARHGDVVLISDGGGVTEAAFREARRIRESGGTVSVVSVSGTGPGLPPADPEALRRLAIEGAGVFADGADIAAVSRHLARRQGAMSRDAGIRSLIYADLGRWILVPAMGLLLHVARRRR